MSGATAIRLTEEIRLLVSILEADRSSTGWLSWPVRMRDALQQAQVQYSFLFYGTDWLAFGHFVIAIAFIGALRDPVHFTHHLKATKWLLSADSPLT